MRIEEIRCAESCREGRESFCRSCIPWSLMRIAAIRGCSRVVVLRLETAIPYGKQRPSLRYTRTPRDGAGRARIKVIVQCFNLPRLPVTSEDIRKGGACKRGERQAEERLEQGQLRCRRRRQLVVREIRL
jgi:hypothetical protein